ncbi:MAG: P-loop containing nucleoside triphosphate hydrolase protein [Olpidium bornovanus]|uniref:P-loop containing nucleoside triphosphate hydrolase protein n=1 Tax=Olpidium bornovanus TaxID=278681 RepID=A0A8H7ZPD1_9FUNG|nr:MAG: P-loop containing nucleoside triphosphate hydrolase protein [Olpidium bornovanus]
MTTLSGSPHAAAPAAAADGDAADAAAAGFQQLQHHRAEPPPPPPASSLLAFASDNPYFSAGFGLIGVGAGLSVLRQGVFHAAGFARRRLLVSLEIPSKDKSYSWFLQWMSARGFRSGFSSELSVETSFTQHANGSATANFSLVPGPGTHYFKYNGVWIKVRANPWETVVMTTLSRDRQVFTRLLEEARQAALEKEEGKTVMYTSRPIDSVVLDGDLAQEILRDVRDFLANGKWYNDRGIPYRRGYLLHGPPGSGKSSFIHALAGELGYNICLLNLSERGLTDDRLNHLFSVVPERSLILLEDIDAAFSKREQTDSQGPESARFYTPFSLCNRYQSSVTFSGLLNALDGVAAAEERVIFMTTNYPGKLDAALVRPGRVDFSAHFGYATEAQSRRMFTRFFSGREEEADRFVARLAGRRVTTAQLQGHFVVHRDDPVGALEHVDSIFAT